MTGHASGYVIAALALLWLAVAIGLSMLAARRLRLAQDVLGAARSNATLLELAPARPLLVRADDRIEIDPQLLRELGLNGQPERLSALLGNDSGIAPDDLEALTAIWKQRDAFQPGMPAERRETLINGWRTAVAKTLSGGPDHSA